MSLSLHTTKSVYVFILICVLMEFASVSAFARDMDVQRSIAQHWADVEADKETYYSKEKNSNDAIVEINNQIGEVKHTLKSSPPGSSTHMLNRTKLTELLVNKYIIRKQAFDEKKRAIGSIIESMLKIEDDYSDLSKQRDHQNNPDAEIFRGEVLEFINETISKAKIDTSIMANEIDPNTDPTLRNWVKNTERVSAAS